MKPTIGITNCSKLQDYITSVEQAGGRPRVLEVSESPRKILQDIHGLLLTGGGDVDPVFYGEERHPSVHDAEPGRDEFEIDLVRRAMDAKLPILAICRGAQVLNVAAGGTLVQDIPTAVTSDLRHAIDEPAHADAHEIHVLPGTKLESALRDRVSGEGSCRVNSRHHQSVGRLGKDLVPAATAPDGVVEAIESPGSDFCIGVQWHPENFCTTGEFRSLFETFVETARKRV